MRQLGFPQGNTKAAAHFRPESYEGILRENRPRDVCDRRNLNGADVGASFAREELQESSQSAFTK